MQVTDNCAESALVVTADNLPELDFSPVPGPIRIDLDRVHKYARGGQVVGLREAALPNRGWSLSHEGKQWMELGLSLEEQVSLAIEAGATGFNFAIKETDTNGRITYVYPDFGLREITVTDQAA